MRLASFLDDAEAGVWTFNIPVHEINGTYRIARAGSVTH